MARKTNFTEADKVKASSLADYTANKDTAPANAKGLKRNSENTYRFNLITTPAVKKYVQELSWRRTVEAHEQNENIEDARRKESTINDIFNEMAEEYMKRHPLK